MRTRALLLLSLFGALLGPGCVVHDNQGRNALAGDVNLLWSFGDGETCNSLNGSIGRIQVVIPGESLQNSGSFPCNVSGTQGIQLQNFAPGTYSVTVNAYDASGSVLLYTGSSSFAVDGDITANVTLARQASGGNVDVRWSFLDGQTCSSLGGHINSIQVTIPGQSLQNGGVFPCQVGGVQGIQLQDFVPGGYTVTVQALDAFGGVAYSGSSGFNVNGNTQVTVGLQASAPQPQAGNINLTWSFSDGQTCGSLGPFVSGIQVTIPGQTLANNGFFTCQNSGTQGIQLQNFAAGTYPITVQALTSSGQVAYQGTVSVTVDGTVSVGVSLGRVNHAAPGNVDLLWTFTDGNTCNTLGGVVDHIEVSIPGEALANGGSFPCQVNGTQGIELQNFAPAYYTYTVMAVDVTGVATYQGSGNFQVNGDVTETVGLTRTTQGGLGDISLRWSFLDSNHSQAGCNAAGVEQVEVSIGSSHYSLVCRSNGVDGADFQSFPAGTYEVVLDAYTRDSQGNLVDAYSYDQNVVVLGGRTALVQAQLQPLVGSLDLTYQFANSSCLSSGVDDVIVEIFDSTGTDVSGLNQQPLSCADGANLSYENFTGGTYRVIISGYNAATIQTWGADGNIVVVAGAANGATATLYSCGSPGSGC